MSKTHITKQAEHLSSIAVDAGFTDFHTIWDHPNNASLKAKRDSHVLFPGDKLFIPDLTEKTERCVTAKVHPFVLDLKPLFLRLKLLDLDEKAIANAPCDIKLEPAAASDPDNPIPSTDGNGILEQPIGVDAKSGNVVAHLPPKSAPPAGKGDPPPAPPPEVTVRFDLRIGNLNPETKLSGQQARLNNLGYFAGYTLKDIDELLWAAEEFKCDHITKGFKIRPVIKPAPREGEDAENTAQADTSTGIQDAAIVSALRKVHGK